MSYGVIITLVVLIFVLGLGIVLLLKSSKSAEKGPSSNLKTMVQAQRSTANSQLDNKSIKISENNALALAAAAESGINRRKKEKTGNESLERKLRYANWTITPVQFRLIQVFVVLIVVVPIYIHVTSAVVVTVCFLTPLIIAAILDNAVNKRFEEFDKDYPILLMSYVSLLKTGMNAIQGLEAAGKGLEPHSLVRAEVELLIERLRLGLTEEQAINAFAEDIPHPELELFVQSLLLSRRVGGTLSNTLERLAKQVRKRQQFRKQAVAVVGMERSSSYMIAVIMGLLLGYITIASPELILPALNHPMGKKVFQGGLCVIMWGFFVMRRITDIKV